MLPARSCFGLAVVVAVVTILQTSLTHAISIGGVKPDLMLATVVVLSLRARWQDVFVANWALGILRDLHSVTPVGTCGVLFLLTGLLVGSVGRPLFGDRWPVRVIAAFLSAVICDLSAMGLMVIVYSVPAGVPVRVTLTAALYTAAIAPVLAWLLGRPAKWLRLPTAPAV